MSNYKDSHKEDNFVCGRGFGTFKTVSIIETTAKIRNFITKRTQRVLAEFRKGSSIKYCEAQGKGRAKGRLKKSIVDCQLSIVNYRYRFP